MNPFCYHNGEYKKLSEIHLNPYDIGFLRGYGVFDVMTTHNGKAFLIEEHWERLRNSAKPLNLSLPITFQKYNKIVTHLIKENNFSKSTIRTALSGGISPNGFKPTRGKETFFILIEKASPLPKEVYKNGVKIITTEYERELPLSKTTNYIKAIGHQEEKEKAEAFEILYIKNGKALECSQSNIFIVKDKTIITPEKNLLHGITRNLCISLALDHGMEVEERVIAVEELNNADEVFMTGSNKNIVPITMIDHVQVGEEKPGSITKTMMEIFEVFTKNF